MYNPSIFDDSMDFQQFDMRHDYQQQETNGAVNSILQSIEQHDVSRNEPYTASKLEDIANYGYSNSQEHQQPAKDDKGKGKKRRAETESNTVNQHKKSKKDTNDMKKQHSKKAPLKLKVSLPLPDQVTINQEKPGCSSHDDEQYGDSAPKSVYELNKLLEKQRGYAGALQTIVNGLGSASEILTAGRKILFEMGHKDRHQVAELLEQVKLLKENISNTADEYGIDFCRICKNKDNEPRVVGQCGHAFACIECLPQYFEQVMSKHGGNWICLKCKNIVTFTVLQS